MEEAQYVDFVRTRITQLRLQKNVSEHKMSLDLDKSGSYIRSITNGTALPSLKELFHSLLIPTAPADVIPSQGKILDCPFYNLLCNFGVGSTQHQYT